MISSAAIPQGPYRATRLWNEVVRLFQTGMPTKKHRQFLKTHTNCFTGFDAVEWLHSLLKVNVNFGPHVTRDQTIQLLNKFLKNHVIEDIHGVWGEETFSDSGKLFRFSENDSSQQNMRKPLGNVHLNKRRITTTKKQNLVSSKVFKSTPDLKHTSPDVPIKRNFEKLSAVKEKPLNHSPLNDDVPTKDNDLWKTTYIMCLNRVLHLRDVTEIISQLQVNVDWLVHNMTNVSHSVVAIPPSEELPYWVLSAMKCLAGWPNSSDSGLPSYEGFEKDVFKAILEYFQALPEPLIPPNFYELITTLLIRCEMLDEMCCGDGHIAFNDDDSDFNNQMQSKDQVNKIHKQLVQAQMRHENIALRRRRSGRRSNKRQLFPDESSTLGERKDLTNHRRRVNRFLSVQSLDDVAEENISSRQEDMTSHLDYKIGSVPNLHSWDDKYSDTDCYVSTVPHQTVVSSAISLHSLPDYDEEEHPLSEQDIYASVEDLLLNMSLTTYTDHELIPSKEQDTNQGSLCNDAESKTICKPQMIPKVSYEAQNGNDNIVFPICRVNQNCTEESLSKDQCEMSELHPDSSSKNNNLLPLNSSHSGSEQKSAFYVYHNMTSDGRDLHPDGKMSYLSLPRPATKLTHKVVRREKTSNKSDRLSRKSWGGEDIRSDSTINPRSDIIARKEVPPTTSEHTRIQNNANRIKARVTKLPHVSVGTRDLPLQTDHISRDQLYAKRLSRSHSTLCHQDKFSEAGKPVTPLRLHKSTEMLDQTDPSNANSPLSAALEQARRKFKNLNKKKLNHTLEAFQLCLLLLPPGNRRKLHLLLRFMIKMSSNPHLSSFDDHLSTRAFVVDKFIDCILRSPQRPDLSSRRLSERVVCFLLDHTSSILTVHEKLKSDVEDRKKKLIIEEQKPGVSSKKCISAGNNKRTLKKQYTFCKQVSTSEYESHSGIALNNALSGLLHAIVEDENLSVKEKRKKLKQFEKSYPEIYRSQFPTGEPSLPSTNKKKAVLGGAFRKLRNIRL